MVGLYAVVFFEAAMVVMRALPLESNECARRDGSSCPNGLVPVNDLVGR